MRLGDVAKIELGPETVDSSAVFDGLKAVFIGVYATPTANPLTVIADVRKAFPEIQAGLPQGSRAPSPMTPPNSSAPRSTRWQKTLIEAAVDRRLRDLSFPGRRARHPRSLVTIPLSLIGVMFFMLLMGYSINLLTLLAFVLAIGLVVDDAIVVVENIYRHIEEGMTPNAAALVGAREIALPVIAHDHHARRGLCADRLRRAGSPAPCSRNSLSRSPGSVVVSGFIALTLSPMMCSRLLRPHLRKAAKSAAWPNCSTPCSKDCAGATSAGCTRR